MKYQFLDGDLAKHRTLCLVTSLKVAKRVTRALGVSPILARASQDFKDVGSSTLCVNLDGPVARILIIGGADDAMDEGGFAKLSNAVAQDLLKLPINQASIALEHVRVAGRSSAWKAATVMQACSHSGYRFGRHKSQTTSIPTLARIRMHNASRGSASIKQAIRAANALDQGMALAKDLGNEPPNICNPNYILREARKLAKDPRVSVTDLNEKKMGELGMGAFLAVSQGSDCPGHMIVIKYNGGTRGDAPVVLVGKGITFDTGGISLKPPAAMDERVKMSPLTSRPCMRSPRQLPPQCQMFLKFEARFIWDMPLFSLSTSNANETTRLILPIPATRLPVHSASSTAPLRRSAPYRCSPMHGVS